MKLIDYEDTFIVLDKISVVSLQNKEVLINVGSNKDSHLIITHDTCEEAKMYFLQLKEIMSKL
jgi:hypothetical protein